MEKLKLIIYREFLTKVRNKSFIVLTFLSPILVIGMGFLVFYLTQVNESTVKHIAIVDNSTLEIGRLLQSNESVTYIDLTAVGLDKSKVLVKENNYDGLLYLPVIEDDLKEYAHKIMYFSADTPNLMLIKGLENKIANRLKFFHLEKIGIQAQTIYDATYNVAIHQENFYGEESSKLGAGLKIGLGTGAGYLVMMFIIIYGNSVMRSVIEEKTSRVIEVIVSSVKPFQLLLGKIIGNASAGLLQFFIWGLLIVFCSIAASMFLGVDLMAMNTPKLPVHQMAQNLENYDDIVFVLKEILQLPLVTMVLLFVFYFLGGFFLYSSIYAAIGAAVDSETDTQQFMLPVIIPLMLAVYVGFAAVISDPHGPVATTFSIIPFTSPIVMLMRIPFGVAWYELLGSMLLLVATFLGIVLLAAKIYKVGILMYGKKPSYKDLYKWLRY